MFWRSKMQMRSWWLHVRTDRGGTIVVTVQAPDSYQAIQIARNMYGSNLISESANLMP